MGLLYNGFNCERKEFCAIKCWDDDRYARHMSLAILYHCIAAKRPQASERGPAGSAELGVVGRNPIQFIQCCVDWGCALKRWSQR
jgi:hypothetical protein